MCACEHSIAVMCFALRALWVMIVVPFIHLIRYGVFYKLFIFDSVCCCVQLFYPQKFSVYIYPKNAEEIAPDESFHS